MKNTLPYGGDRAAAHSARTDRVMGYKSGGRVKEGGDTHISITVAPPATDGKAQLASGLAAMAAAAPKPPAPAPLGAGMGGPPAPMGGPPMGMGMKLGGKVRDRNAR